MLPRTPAPKMTESLLGYTLRVSETNGYDTPWHILTYAGFDQSEMQTAGFPVEKLAAILGREASALAHIAHCADEPAGRYFKILGHRLGAGMKDGWLRLTKPEFCPKCAEEDGYLDAFWDLSQAVACPKHGCRLLSVCPTCDKQLRWFRPGLIECKCGANLADAPLPPAAPAVIQLMSVLQAKLHGRSVLDLPNGSCLPLVELETLPLKAVLMMIDRLGRFAALGQDKALRRPDRDIEWVAQMLADWPSGYHTFLERLGTILTRDRPAAIGLRKQFAPFYEAMFKNSRFAVDLAFLRTEFINFGQRVWGEAIIDQKLLRDNTEFTDRFRSKSRTARAMGIRPVTLKRWADNGLVPAKQVKAGKQHRYVFDKSCVPPAVSAGLVLETRKAAARVDLPVSVLRGLKETGHYAINNMPRHKRGFHELDLAALRSRILHRATVLSEIPPDQPQMSLQHVLQEIRFWSKNGKARFVAAYLDGAIGAIGRTGELWSEVFFRRSEVEEFASLSRTAASNSAISRQEAASRLGCGLDVVAGLLTHGFLEGRPGADRIRVTQTSVDQFAARYVFLATLARRWRTSARRLDRLCTVSETQTFGVSRKSGIVAKFICVSEEQRLAESRNRSITE